DFVRQHSTLPVPDRTEFESWEAFDTYIRSYQSETCQVFRLRTNKKVGERNTIIERTGSKSPPIPETWVWYAKTLVCTHAGKFKSRGKGKRARQESRSIECPAQFGDSVLQTVGALQKAGAGKKNILQFITENSDCTPTIRDVHNLVRKLKARTTQSTTSAQRLKAWMIDFCGEHGNVGRIFVEARQSKKIATCITMQTQHMRYLYDRFPEVLLIDATHGTNAPKYKIFSFMIHDTFGKGQAMDAIAQIDKAIVWTKTICFDTKIDPWYLVEEDERLLDGLKDTRLQSTGFEILDIVGRGHFSDASLSRVLEKLYSSNSSVVVVTPDLFGWVVGRKITMDTESVEAILSTISGECAIIPISCNSNHWCAIMIDIAKRIVYIYDAMRSSYQYSVRVVAEKLTPCWRQALGN
ncbi:hypothetical protein L916_21590, partial [Phytophthora nicotianae]